MYLLLLWQILYMFFNVGLTLASSSSGTSFIQWSEDDWLETRFSINTKFIFNGQRYDQIILRTRMNEWSLELSYSNGSNANKLWTELHLFFDHRHHSSGLNNSIHGHVRNLCYEPIISPLTNDSNTRIPKLADMDERIANYFVSDGFFRTINYIQCTFDERRRNPSIHIQINIYLVTNREFQSLLYIEMSNLTRSLFSDHQARFYLHNNEQKLKYNFNISNIDYPLNSNTVAGYMIKIYSQTTHASNNSVMTMMSSNILFKFFLFCIFCLFIK